MRVAAIDIGTNSALLTVVQLQKPGKLQGVYEAQKITRLGKGTDKSKKLSMSSMRRTLAAVRQFQNIALKYRAEKIWAVGTSALREAANRHKFIKMVKRGTGLKVEIISGKKEAILTFKGALLGLKLKTPKITLIDIGGGSTEISWVTKGRLRKSISLDLGSVRLTEQYFPKNLSNKDRIWSLNVFLCNNWNKLAEWKFQDSILVGTAGTVTTLAALDLDLRKYNSGKVHGHSLAQIKVQKLFEKLCSLNLSRRKKLLSTEPKRADVIVAGSAILLSFMQFFKFERIIVSDRGLRWGLIRHKLRLN
ncbi:MAG: hypothetical protein A2142_03075 [candidate division Zixibacteria bacterium RBG_16_48_11]|nr:MAG: hypothetical protein A2142_03075 [candidate division Zixibacteria bacterium RBG_16_48_11]